MNIILVYSECIMFTVCHFDMVLGVSFWRTGFRRHDKPRWHFLSVTIFVS